MALFEDTADFATVFPLLESTEWTMLLPFLELREQELLSDEVLGTDLYAALHADYQASIAGTPVALPARSAALLPYVRKALAFLTIYDAMPTLGVIYGATGPMEVSTANQAPARMWKQNQAAARMLLQGNSLLNQLIAFLLGNESDYPEWADAPVRVEVRESLVPDMRSVRRYLKLHGAWLLHQLRPSLRNVQEGPVKSLLGDTAYTTLLAHVVADTVTSDEQILLEQIRPAMLHWALANEATPLQLTIDSRGIWTWEMSGSGGGQVSGGEKAATNPRLTALIRHHNAMAESHMESLRKLVQPEDETPPPIMGRTGSIGFGG